MIDDCGLETFIEGSKILRLNSSAHAAEILLKRLSQKGYLDEGIANDLNTTFRLEYGQMGDREERDFEILEEIVWSAINIKKKKTGKYLKLGLHDYLRIKELEKNLEVIYDEIHLGSISERKIMLLLCLAHIVRWEVRGRDVKKQLKDIGGISFSQRADYRDKLINEFLMVEELGSDGQPDTFHIRNAIAHGRFSFQEDDLLELWDVKQGTKTETYRTKKDRKALTDFCNAFETKLRFVSLYYSFLGMMNKISESIEKQNRERLKT